MAPPNLPHLNNLVLLAAGGFAIVWECVRAEDGAPMVVKVGRSTHELGRERFQREAETLDRVGPPHAPILYERGSLHDGRPYLVMEHLGRAPLSVELSARSESPDQSWVRSASLSIVSSIKVVHSYGIVHRDLKPENIFLATDKGGVAKLIDFGINKDLRHRKKTITREGTVFGTSEYMSPEQLASPSDIDYRTDIYSFGVILYELLTLRLPFIGEPAAIEHGHQSLRPPKPSQFVEVPKAVEDVCLACLAKNPERRPVSAAVLERELTRAFASGSGAGRRPRSETPPVASKLLTSAHQPVVLLALFVPTLDQDVGSLVSKRKGFVARQWGRRYVCAFSGLLGEDPVQEALAAARELEDQFEARVALHLATLKIRRDRRTSALKVYGSEVERPETWLPDDDWTGVLLTAEMAKAVPANIAQPAPAMDGFSALSTEHEHGQEVLTPLIGRESVLTQAEQSWRQSRETRTPGLFTVLGEHGLGKSRIASELGQLVTRSDLSEARLISLRATRRGVHESDDTCRLLLAELAAIDPDQTGEGEIPISSEMPALAVIRALGEGLRQAARLRPLIVVVDDVHYADNITLDTLEYATLDGHNMRLWVVALAHPRLKQRRPQWGRRAHRHDQVTLDQLDEASAMEVAAELLRPAEYPPAATLRRLAQWTGGNPHLLNELVDNLKQSGIVRKRPHGESWYVATAELDQLPPSPVGQWMATRELNTLPQELAACARLCSVLGVQFLRDELDWVLNASERTSTASTPVDVDVGLRELEHRGILTHSTNQIWWFNQANFQDAVYKLLATKDCQELHRHALAFWRTQTGAMDRERVLASIARHAGASGEHKAAADAYLELGDRARANHQYVDADEHYTAALKFIAHDDDGRRIRGLGGRAKVRYRMQRLQEALDDISAARESAQQTGDESTQASLLLEEAIVLDWANRFSDAARRVEEARSLIERLNDDLLDARRLMAEGRSCWREERVADAVTLLSQAAESAAQLGDRETRIQSLLLLGPALVFAGRPDEARERLDEVIMLCEQVGDGLHLCGAYGNRMFVWRNAPTNAIADLRQAVQLARELGLPGMERVTTHNLAEILHWAGEDRQSLRLARRARVLLERFYPAPVPDDWLLLARIRAARSEYDEVGKLITWVNSNIPAEELAPSDKLMLTMLGLLADSSDNHEFGKDWDRLINQARDVLAGEEFLEILYFCVRAAMERNHTERGRRALEEAEGLLHDHTIWEQRFQTLREFSASVPGHT